MLSMAQASHRPYRCSGTRRRKEPRSWQPDYARCKQCAGSWQLTTPSSIMLSDSGINTPHRWHLTIVSGRFVEACDSRALRAEVLPGFLPKPLNKTQPITTMINRKIIFPIAADCSWVYWNALFAWRYLIADKNWIGLQWQRDATSRRMRARSQNGPAIPYALRDSRA